MPFIKELLSSLMKLLTGFWKVDQKLLKKFKLSWRKRKRNLNWLLRKEKKPSKKLARKQNNLNKKLVQPMKDIMSIFLKNFGLKLSNKK